MVQNKRVIAFVDGQNLFNAAKQAFGYHFPNYDALKLAQLVCEQRGQAQQEHWTLVKLHFYSMFGTCSCQTGGTFYRTVGYGRFDLFIPDCMGTDKMG